MSTLRRPAAQPPASEEAQRLAAVRSLAILDTAAEADFDEITALAAGLCRAPMAAVGLLDADRLWLKSVHGSDALQLPRHDTLTNIAIQSRSETTVVVDARTDPRFAALAPVTGAPHIRFYAGTPLRTESGHAVGALCVASTQPHRLSTHEVWALSALGRHTSRMLVERAARGALIDTQSAIDAIIGMDGQGRIISFNNGAAKVFGYRPADAIGQPASMLIPSEFIVAHEAGVARLRAGHEPRLVGQTVEVRARRCDGSTFAAELSLSMWRRDGAPCFTAVLRDVTAARRCTELQALTKQAAVTANDSEKLSDALIRVLPQVISAAGATSGQAWLVPAANLGAESPAAELEWLLVGDLRTSTVLPSRSVQPPTDCPVDPAVQVSALPDGSAVLQIPVLLDGTQICAVLSLSGPAAMAADVDLHDALGQIALQLRHVAGRQRSRELVVQALTDPLTGLANRSGLIRTLQRRLDHCTEESAGALLFLDLDRFKNVNDLLGHGIGDDVLLAATTRLKALVRSQDTLARLGGDEFVILCGGGLSLESVQALARRLIHALEQPFPANATYLYLGVSIGIVVLGSNTSAERAVRQADIAMERAKSLGGNRFAVYDTAMDSSLQHTIDIDSALHRAVDHNELTQHYQPIVDPVTRGLVGFEALVRWNRPGHGLVPPDDFIPVAERNGLILRIGWQVLLSACKQLADWSRARPEFAQAYMAVNVAATQLLPEFYDLVMGVLEEAELAPDRLTLEITESALLTDVDRTRDLLLRLRGEGIRIALDDFGTGYSSLSYLRQLPVDVIKIDRSFVTSLGNSTRGDALFDVVLNLADALNLSVVTEGIETEQQAAFLRQRDCNAAQGYLYSRPVPAADIAALFAPSPHGAVLL